MNHSNGSCLLATDGHVAWYPVMPATYPAGSPPSTGTLVGAWDAFLSN